MAERSKAKSLRRVDLARRFVEIGRIKGGLPSGVTLKHAFIGLGIALLTTALLIEYEFQHIPDFSVGDIADRTVEAPRDFTVIDEPATREKRETALRDVPVVFTFDFRVTHRVASEIRMAFADARQILAEEKERLGVPQDRGLPAQALRELKSRIEDMLPRLSHGRVLSVCLQRGFAQELEDQLVQLLTQSMKAPGVVLNRATLLRFRDRGIALHNLVTGEMEELSDWLAIRDLAQAREILRQQEYELSLVTSDEKRELIDFLEQWVVPNTYFDEEATRRLEERALAQVDPVVLQVKQGRTIVRTGDEITEHSLSQLSALGELQLSDRWLDRVLGVLIVVLFMYFVLWSYFRLELLKTKSRHDFALLVMVVLGSLLLGRLFIGLAETVAFSLRVPELQDPVHFYFFAPLALGSVLAMLLLGVNQAILCAVMTSVFTALLTGQVSIAVWSLTGSLMAIYTLRQYRERSTLVRAGLWIGGVNLLVALAFQLSFTPQAFSWLVFLVRSGGAMVSGLLSVTLATLVLPSLETLFRLTTDIRLLELSNLNSPILRRLALEAPGTYHHSITVGTLAEAGAEAIGANALLIRVGAYYHDIGKLKHPEYYVENQIFSVNKHENLSPTMSSLILASHVKDGLAIADETKLGPKVASLIPQHHGTRVMTYFFQKAREASADKGVEVSEDDFRYPGPKPQSKEAAILMLADQVEAAARTLQEPTPGQIRSLINRITHATIQDGQFDECDITMKEVSQVAKAFERVLTGMYHHRIEYPGFSFNKRPVEERQLESQRLQ
jgi:cyclic-di-AMP phosphodiesterase PgpH